MKKKEAKYCIKKVRKEAETAHILSVLVIADGNQVKAARLMGIHRNALLYKVHKYDLKKKIEIMKNFRRNTKNIKGAEKIWDGYKTLTMKTAAPLSIAP